MKEPFFKFDRENKVYKLIDLFLDDDQKESLALNVLVFGFAHALNIKFFRQHMDFLDWKEKESLKAARVVTDKYVLVVAYGPSTIGKTGNIIYKKRGLLSKWDELEPPKEVYDLINKVESKDELRKVMTSIMKMKAFW